MIVLAVVPVLPLLVFRVVNPPTTSFMLQTAARLHGASPPRDISHKWVGLDRIAACMPLAVVAAEDQTFPTNSGFAWAAIWQALQYNAKGEGVRGGSTITQQAAKNLFLWPARTYIRKAIEADITFWMNLLWPKRRIMAVYLNIAQFSQTAFGVEAAARQLFHTSARHLTPYQCAALAAVLPAPDRYDAANPGSYVAKRKAWILRQMRNLGTDYLQPVLGSSH